MKAKLILKKRSYKGRFNPNYKLNSKTHTNICKCGKKISFYAKRCLYCYRKTLKEKGNPMYGIHRFGKKAPNYIDGRKNRSKYCIDCNKKLFNYCANRCGSCNKKHFLSNPKNHPGWQGGIGKLPYSFEFTKELKEQIRKRDNHKCQLCNKNQKYSFRKLDIHHIDYNKVNCKQTNLIALCNECNKKVNANRDYWFAYFTYIMENR